MKLERTSIELLKKGLEKLEAGFDLADFSESFDIKKMEDVVLQVADKMQNNYPYFHPLFAGQMLKPPHPIAKAAYMLSMWINPNNHAIDGSKASSPMEKEAVADIANMFGWNTHLGHLTSGGTMANLEALWVAGKLHPEKKIIASDQAHYTHSRISEVLKLNFAEVRTTQKNIIDLNALEDRLKEGNVGTVVCTIGTTSLGTIDPLREVMELQKKYTFRIHADAAYGGYFSLIENLKSLTADKFTLLKEVDSIVIDPHKQGLQPYGCGCVLFKNPDMAKFYIHDSPYTYFTSNELHLGEISLECSRAGSSAVALWATHQLMPLKREGVFAKGLAKSIEATSDLYNRLKTHHAFLTLMQPETDIVVWAIKGETSQEMSEMASRFFQKAEENNLYLSLYKYPTNKLKDPTFEINSDYLLCLRSCLMKPNHLEWLDAIWIKMLDSLP